MPNRDRFLIFISGYWAIVLFVLGLVGMFLAHEVYTGFVLFGAAAIFGGLWVYGRRLQ